MKFATATYGDAMIRAAEMDVLGKFDNRLPPSFDKISEHTGLPKEDIVSMDLDYGGNVRRFDVVFSMVAQRQILMLPFSLV